MKTTEERVPGKHSHIGRPPANAPRWMHRAYATAGSFFWLPCPICGEDFGGHEWGETLYLGGGMGNGVCNKVSCGEAAKRLSETVSFLEVVETIYRPPINEER